MFTMFNTVNMPNGAATNFSKSKSIGFRPTPNFRGEVESLVASTAGAWNLSDVARVGLTTFWPQIQAIVRASAQPPAGEKEIGDLREHLALCQLAQARGLDIRAALTAALAAHLEAGTPATVAA
ncbi:MAG: hypothetical protein H7343_12210 [Undibacterium sp.]|nr:hypothetical protein [Opitutaceae bacterium]